LEEEFSRKKDALTNFLNYIELGFCSQKQIGSANFTFKMSIPLAAFSGGGVVFEKSDTGDQFVRPFSDNTIIESLPNGTWSFGAIA
jgi:hypothetical protein